MKINFKEVRKKFKEKPQEMKQQYDSLMDMMQKTDYIYKTNANLTKYILAMLKALKKQGVDTIKRMDYGGQIANADVDEEIAEMESRIKEGKHSVDMDL